MSGLVIWDMLDLGCNYLVSLEALKVCKVQWLIVWQSAEYGECGRHMEYVCCGCQLRTRTR